MTIDQVAHVGTLLGWGFLAGYVLGITQGAGQMAKATTRRILDDIRARQVRMTLSLDDLVLIGDALDTAIDDGRGRRSNIAELEDLDRRFYEKIAMIEKENA